MRKLSVVLVFLLMLLAGCSKGKNTSTTPLSNDKAKAESYTFVSNGTEINMNAKAEPILKALGKEQNYFEADSCAYQGKDKVYTYSGFEFHTYQMDKVDYVGEIVFLDDSVSTKEGISIGSSMEDVKKAYGNKFTQTEDGYVYEKGKSKLTFTFKDSKVDEVDYLAITE